ncbi:MAG: hypothetical protein UH249_06925 [Acutalibacteraceae bacterium]|nr:hypothetical protein [Acutalibacteraceae bacterium]
MKSYQKYIIVPIVTFILTILYGFIIGGELALWFAGVLFIISIFILVLFERKSSDNKLFVKILKVIVTAILMVGLSATLYAALNQTVYTIVNSFETEITDFGFSTRDWGNETDAYFITPDGEESYVTIYKDATLEIGEKITVDECRGFFGADFYRYRGTAE